MRLVRLDPPGTLCLISAVLDRVGRVGANRTVIDVGCGGGSLLAAFCAHGFVGVGIDPSAAAIAAARLRLAPHLASGRCTLRQGTLEELAASLPSADVVLNAMTLEHVVDEVGFLRSLVAVSRPAGLVLVMVPGRMDHWSFEDEVVGHLRRYERQDLSARLREVGLRDVEVWSVSVPVANLLFAISRWLVRRATPAEVRSQDAWQQTATSGVRRIPFKTVFPRWFRWFLNTYTVSPLFVLQRLFYHSDFGITLLAYGSAPAALTCLGSSTEGCKS